MLIISWNVNGLRAALKNNFLPFIKRYEPDILGIQETKLQENQIPVEIQNLEYYKQYWSCAVKKGYSGTCLFSKITPKRIRYELDDEKFNGEGRIIQANFDDFVLFNIYFPNGQMNEERLQYKLAFNEQVIEQIECIRQRGTNILVMGDFNIAHTEIDLSHPKANEKYSGFLPIERAWIDKIITLGYVDTFRYFHQEPLNYTWWSYRAGARIRNIGWRIDYCFVNNEFLPRVKKAFILSEVFGSDHCPVGVEIDLVAKS